MKIAWVNMLYNAILIKSEEIEIKKRIVTTCLAHKWGYLVLYNVNCRIKSIGTDYIFNRLLITRWNYIMSD